MFLQCVCKRKVVFLGGNIRSKSVLFGLKVCQKAPSPVCLRKTEERCCTMDEISKFCPINVRYLSLLFKSTTIEIYAELDSKGLNFAKNVSLFSQSCAKHFAMRGISGMARSNCLALWFCRTFYQTILKSAQKDQFEPRPMPSRL